MNIRNDGGVKRDHLPLLVLLTPRTCDLCDKIISPQEIFVALNENYVG
jgi:hypothetical protein